jgi:hypothetical protein
VQLTDIVAHTPGVVSRMVDGEAVLVDPKKGMVRVLNPAGARIWEMIDGQRTVAALAADIAAEYGIDAARAQADTITFCEDLVRRGVLTISR